MSSTDRVLGVLDLFTVEEPVWTADSLIDRLGASRATLYRYLKALVASGFLAPAGRGSYVLGPRFIELDRQIRLADPLLAIAPPIMAAQRDQVAGTQLLCRYYGLRVLSIHEERSDPSIKTSFDRGRPFSLFLGSTSRIILANLGAPHLRRLYLHHAADIAEAGLGKTWTEFRDILKEIRLRGVAVASDIDRALVGIAAPIFAEPETVIGSLALVRMRKVTGESEIEMLSKLAISAANKISTRLQRQAPK